MAGAPNLLGHSVLELQVVSLLRTLITKIISYDIIEQERDNVFNKINFSFCTVYLQEKKIKFIFKH